MKTPERGVAATWNIARRLVAALGLLTPRVGQRYTKAANRERLALQAGKIIAGTELANLDTRLANQSKKS